MAVKRMMGLDREMIDGLKGIGFKFDVGEDGTGHQMKYRRRGGGYNLDAGSSELMIKGEIDLLQNDTIERFCEQGALLKDGSVVPADLIVLATGYFPQGELVRRSLGEHMAGRIGQVWGQTRTASSRICSSGHRRMASGSLPKPDTGTHLLKIHGAADQGS